MLAALEQSAERLNILDVALEAGTYTRPLLTST
jgi:hypothetical protein